MQYFVTTMIMHRHLQNRRTEMRKEEASDSEAHIGGPGGLPPVARVSHGNVNADNFDDCFRYWEIRSFGDGENISRNLLFSKSPKRQAAKTNTRNHVEIYW